MRAYYWIDVLDLFKTYDETFGAGFRFQPEQILVEANINVMLQNKLDGLRKHFSDKDVRKDVLDNLIRQLTKESFLETGEREDQHLQGDEFLALPGTPD